MPYESKPMKKQWIEVDGKMTPIILPQIWCHEKQDWVVTSEKNPLPTQVTGSNVEIIKEYTELNTDERYRNMYFGDNVVFSSSQMNCLDVSPYSSLLIYIRNNTEESVRFHNLYFCLDRQYSSSRAFNFYNNNINIPAGASVWITKRTEPDSDALSYLDDTLTPFMGFGIQTDEPQLPAGSLNVVFIGRKYC